MTAEEAESVVKAASALAETVTRNALREVEKRLRSKAYLEDGDLASALYLAADAIREATS